MKVELISHTTNPLDTIYVGARTCYYPGTPTQLVEIAKSLPQQKKIEFVDKIIESGHMSVIEHANFTFAIEGISRAAAQQLLRHRHTSPSGQSLRYVELKENRQQLEQMSVEQLLPIVDKYFVDVNKNNAQAYASALINYLKAIENGAKAEDARNFLPLGTKTNLVDTFNLREMIHISHERLCSSAQNEIHNAVKLMKSEIGKIEPWMTKYLIAKCLVNGICKERHSCGLYKQFKEKQR